jgi:SAM-dependent methyltransferase
VTSWSSYLDEFHTERAGVTEDVFAHLAEGHEVYDWMLAPLDAGERGTSTGRVLDLACGSAPLSEVLVDRWVGLDRSLGELGRARARGARRLMRGDATALALPTESVDAVVCSMGLMLLAPIERALREVARVLRPRGRFVVVVPDTRPLTWRDRARYARLLWRLRRPRLAYPNDVAGLAPRFDEAGFDVLDDTRRRFALAVDRVETADRFVRSLYLPGVDRARVDAAARVAARWVGSDLGIPLRRIVAVRRALEEDALSSRPS